MTDQAIQGIKVIEARGSHSKIGEIIGEAMREELQRKWERAGRKQPDEEMRDRIRRHLASSEQHMPGVMQEIRGLERGAGLPEGYLMAEWTGKPSKSNFPDACSNIVFKDGPDGPLWGKNNDDDWSAAPPGAQSPHYILKVYPDDGIPVINCTYKGWVGAGDMLNAEGVASGFSSGGSLFFQSPYHVPDRLWLYAGMQKARTAEEYARHITALPLCGKGYLGVTVDRGGNMFSAEIMPPMTQIRRPAGWMRGMNCTNCYQLPLLKDLSGRGAIAEAQGRSRYLDAALREGDLSLEHMKAILQYHGENDICRHGAERHDLGFTEWSMIGSPRQGKVLFCRGNPCQGKYEEVGF